MARLSPPLLGSAAAVASSVRSPMRVARSSRALRISARRKAISCLVRARGERVRKKRERVAFLVSLEAVSRAPASELSSVGATAPRSSAFLDPASRWGKMEVRKREGGTARR